jgi:hypothetical protein
VNRAVSGGFQKGIFTCCKNLFLKGGFVMSLGKTWYTVEEATEKFGVAQEQILLWVSAGIIRTEKETGQMMLINGDDLDLKLHEQKVV